MTTNLLGFVLQDAICICLQFSQLAVIIASTYCFFFYFAELWEGISKKKNKTDFTIYHTCTRLALKPVLRWQFHEAADTECFEIRKAAA